MGVPEFRQEKSLRIRVRCALGDARRRAAWWMSRISTSTGGIVRVPGCLTFPNMLSELRSLGRQHGTRFLLYAISIEILEDVVLPAVFIALGQTWLAGLALVLHSEPVTYPLYFVVAGWLRRRARSRGLASSKGACASARI